MADKAVPEYMKRYMENIGENCFPDYELLSREYHKSVQVYHEMRFPSRISLRGGPAFKQDVPADLHRIEEEFKSRSLDIARDKYGYKDPGYEDYDKDLSGMQEDGIYNGLSKDNFGLSAEDIRARKAHVVFEKENPDKVSHKEDNRSVIDYYYNGPDGLSERKPEVQLKDMAQKTVEKEPRSKEAKEALIKDYSVSGKDISKDKNRFSMSGRFFMSLSSGKDASSPARHDVSKDKNEIDMDRDF